MNETRSGQITKDLLASVLKEQQEAFLKKDLGIEREALHQVKKALKSPQVIVITGLRRTGKSTLLAQAAHDTLKDGFYFVNFEDERLINFQVTDFDLLHETLISLFGDKKTFLFDEIQNVPEWERFIRRLHDQGYKFIITGSNASLLSQELGTRLTGRSLTIELFPFSFREFLKFKSITPNDLQKTLTTREKGELLKITNEYLTSGGIPDALKYPHIELHKTLYDDILYRDIATRHSIQHIKSLKELTFYLISNIASPFSLNKLKQLLKLGSVNTIKNYIEYLENSWLLFIINKYAYSIKNQQIAAKKIYSIDTGLTQSIGFSFSKNHGKLMENAVFLELKRKKHEIYYYQTEKGYEVDFFIPKENTFIQVAQHLETDSVREREIRSLLEIGEEKKGAKRLIITEREKGTLHKEGVTIEVIPLYEWLLQ